MIVIFKKENSTLPTMIEKGMKDELYPEGSFITMQHFIYYYFLLSRSSESHTIIPDAASTSTQNRLHTR